MQSQDCGFPNCAEHVYTADYQDAGCMEDTIVYEYAIYVIGSIDTKVAFTRACAPCQPRPCVR